MKGIETVTRIDGNGRPYTLPLPKLVIHGYMNNVALAHVYENTGLQFEKGCWDTLEAQPETSSQIAALFLTYNFKTRYYNNLSLPNQLHLKSDHHIGFEVDSICYECVKANHIGTNWKGDGRLAC